MNAFVTLRKRLMTAFCIMAVLLLCSVGGVMASGGGGHDEAPAAHGEAAAESHGGGSHWQATDTYKVMNFAVLAIGLFFLLKKPVSQALNARIDGINRALQIGVCRGENANRAPGRSWSAGLSRR